jgi:hypothetical protein
MSDLQPPVGERRVDRWIARMRKHHLFDQLVKQLVVDKKPVYAIAIWAEEQRVAPPMSRATWRQYLYAMRKKFKQEAKKGLGVDAVVRQAEQNVEKKANGQTRWPGNFERLQQTITKEFRSLTSELMLKYCFAVMQNHVEQMIEMQEKVSLPNPEFYKSVLALKEIAVEVRKHEMGERYLKGKLPMDNDSFLSETISHTPVGEMDDLTPRVSELDAVDRNLLREAGMRVIDLIREEVAQLRTEAEVLELESATSVFDGG